MSKRSSRIPKHITKYSIENGHRWNGFRICVVKGGVCFRRYIAVGVQSWEEAEAKAKQLVSKLEQKLSKIAFYDTKTLTEYLDEFKQEDV